MIIIRCALVVALSCSAVQARAQDRGLAPNTDPFAALTAEVRLLRIAIEKSTQIQTQVQGLSVYLSAQQSRLIQLFGRLDAARAALDSAVAQTHSVSQSFAANDPAQHQGLQPDARARMEAERSHLKNEIARLSASENQFRVRHSEAEAELQTELTRWSQLTNMLEQLIKLQPN